MSEAGSAAAQPKAKRKSKKMEDGAGGDTVPKAKVKKKPKAGARACEFYIFLMITFGYFRVFFAPFYLSHSENV